MKKNYFKIVSQCLSQLLIILTMSLLPIGWLKAGAATIHTVGIPTVGFKLSFPALRLEPDATRVELSELNDAKSHRGGVEAFMAAEGFRVTPLVDRIAFPNGSTYKGDHRENSAAPTTLVAGDIAVIGFNANDDDTGADLDGDGKADIRWAIMTMVTLDVGTVVHFTDAGFTDIGTFLVNAANEGHLTWTITSPVSAGTVLVMDTADGSNFNDLNGATAGTGGLSDYGTVSGGMGGTPSGANTFMASTGDQIIVYQGTAGTTVGATFIYALSNSQDVLLTSNGVWQTSGAVTAQQQSYLPTGLINGSTAIALTTKVSGVSNGIGTIGLPNYGFDNMIYQGTLSGTKAQFRAAIGNPASWAGHDTSPFSIGVGAGFSYTSNFTIVSRPTLVSATFADNALKIGETSTVTFVFSTAVTSFTTADLTVPNGVINSLGSSDGGTTWTGNFTPSPNVTDATNAITVDLTGVTSVSGSLAGIGTVDSDNYAIDTQAPSVSSIVVSGSPTAAATSVDFTVNFSELVNNISTDDFALGTTGTATGTITSVSASSGTSVVVTVSGIAGIGTIKVNLNSSTNITDAVGNVSPVAYISGASHTVTTNYAPSIANLNGDSVAWPGVGNLVTLDVGGNATITDTQLDASNWNGASLTVQRASTSLAADVFGFNAVGYSVSGGNLQSGSSITFGTFTNTNGLLKISFNANATNTLVRDVVRSIQYQNDRPAGDATIRFTLSDGSLSTTADVTVNSDIIYVTNTTDTQIINLADGVSFSEAVAIAAADVTGSQTLVFTNSFNTNVSLAGSLAINESLTFNADAASGLIISGGTTITLGGGTTLSFTNASGIVVISSPLGGSGSLTKDGGGTLTLSSVSNEANMSGGITVNAGTLQISSDNHLSSGTLTLNGGTLTNSSSAFIIDNAISLGSNGGTINVGGGSGATLLTLSGVISGTGNLTKNGQAILQLNGNNTYSGATNLMAGTIIATHSNALGTTAGATIVSSGATLRFTGGLTVAEALTISGTGKTVSSVYYGALHLISGSSTLSGSVTLAGDADISATGGTLFVSGALIGSGNLNKTDVGSLLLSNTGTEASMSGGITVTAGVLSIDNDDQLSSGTLSLSGGTLAVIDVTTIDNNIDITASSTISISGDATFSGVISGAGDLTKNGASTLSLTGANTATGAVNISAGGLTIIGGSSIGNNSAVTVASNATLTLDGGNETIGSLAGSGNVVLNYRLTTGGNNTSTTFSGIISGTGNGITKTGSGTFTLSGTNTYTGSTLVSAGTLGLSGGAAISDASAVTVSSGATISLNASETLGSLAGAGNVSLNGFTLSSGGNNTSTTFSGALDGSGGFSKTGSGMLILSGSNSGTFTGGTTVSGGGTLSVASDDNLGSGTLTINNSTFGITGATTIDNSITLINSATISNTAAATISNAISGSGSLSKAGSSVLSLSGTSNYGGSTTVLAGTLSVAGALNGTSAVSVSSGAILTGSGSVTNLIVSSGGTLSPGNSPGVFTVNGNLQMNSGSTLAVEINGVTAGTGYDQVIVNGTVNLSGSLVASHGYSAVQGDIYTIIVNDMADLMIDTFSGLAEGATITAGGNGSVLTASYIGGTGNDFTLTAPNNAAPVIANLNGDSVSFIEDSDQVVLDAGNDATVTDGDSMDLDGGNVTVSIVNNRINTEDVISIRNQGTSGGQIGTSGLNVTYGGTIIGTRTANGGTDTHDLVITLNSAASPAIVQALVRNLIYINTNTTTPTTTTRSVEVTVNDGDGGISNYASIDVAVVAVNDAPMLTATGATPTFTEGGSAVALFNGTTINTVEAGELIKTLIFTITNVANGSSEVITVDGSSIHLTNGFSATTVNNAIDASVSVTGSTATLTLSKTAGISVAAGQTLVDVMTYSNSSITPDVINRVVTITSIQDNGGTANGGIDVSSLSIIATVSISAVNTAPVITTSAGITAFTEGNNVTSIPVIIDPGLSVSYLDHAILASATVSITTGFQAIEDVLAFSNDGSTMGNISATYTSVTGVLSLSSTGASATLAEWQSALASITYTNTSETPSSVARTISFEVNDGEDQSSASTKSVSVASVNDTPIISGTPGTTVAQDAAYSFTPVANDLDGDLLTFSITNKPLWANFDAVTGALTGTPANANVGTSTDIVISVSDGTASTSLPAFNLQVTTLVISGITLSDEIFVYDGSAKSLAIIGTPPPGTDVSFVNNSLTGVGTQTVTATVSGTGYNPLVLTANLTVSPATITGITLAHNNFVYDGLEKSLEIAGALPSGTAVAYSNNSQTNVGTQVVTATISGANHTSLVLSANLTVTPATITGITLVNNSFVYDGAAKSLTITGILPWGTSVNYADNTLTNVGIQEVTATISGSNYNDLVLKANLSISKAVITGLTLSSQSYVYDGTAKSLNITGTLPSGTSVNYANNTLTNAGTQEVTATISGSNYNDLVLKANIVLTKKVIAVTATANSKTYGDADPELTYTFTPTLIIGNTFAGALSRTPGENVGNYIITQGTLTAGDNYSISYTSGSLAVTKAILTARANNAQICQGNRLPVFTTSYSGFKYSENESILASKATVTTTGSSSSPASNYTLIPGGAVSNNYSFNYVNGTLTINALPVVSINSDKGIQISKGESVFLTATGGTNYTWGKNSSIVNGLNSATLEVRPRETTTYTLTVTNASGCSETKAFTLTVIEDYEKVKATNILSPNGDGINDKWLIDNIDLYPNNEVKIFNKAGRIIYSKKGYDNSWDATLNGMPLAEGTYYYVIDFGSNRRVLKGFITVVRND